MLSLILPAGSDIAQPKTLHAARLLRGDKLLSSLLLILCELLGHTRAPLAPTERGSWSEAAQMSRTFQKTTWVDAQPSLMPTDPVITSGSELSVIWFSQVSSSVTRS